MIPYLPTVTGTDRKEVLIHSASHNDDDDVKRCKKGGCLCLEDELSVAKVNLALVLAFGDAGALVL